MGDTTTMRSDCMNDWLEATAARHSRRAFDGVAVAADRLDQLAETCEGFRPFGDARVVLVIEHTLDVFTGIVGSYGKISGAPHVLAMIADETSPTSQAHVGYVGEAAILEATVLGLDTCWVGGFFDAKKAERLVKLAPGERIVAVSPVGIACVDRSVTERAMGGMAGSHKRKSADEIAPGSSGWPAWAQAAVVCARLAPSAVNRQPWRFSMEDRTLVLARDNAFETPKVTKALDCGIAMLHAELGALGAGVTGTWRDCNGSLRVATFEPSSA